MVRQVAVNLLSGPLGSVSLSAGDTVQKAHEEATQLHQSNGLTSPTLRLLRLNSATFSKMVQGFRAESYKEMRRCRVSGCWSRVLRSLHCW